MSIASARITQAPGTPGACSVRLAYHLPLVPNSIAGILNDAP